VSLVKDEYILQGTVDLIRGEGDTVEIVDFKSSKKLDIFSERDKLETYHRQLEVYAHLVEERTGYQVSKLHLYFTGEDNSNPYISFRKNSQSIDATIAKFDEVVSCIEGKRFEVKERPLKLCQNCDMRHYCDSI
jgi:DNA helicase-2/ATP-dependent DNA helicase PcrA